MKLSIIIPTYNRAHLLQRATKSVLRAKVPVEIVIIDDGSTDGTEAFVKILQKDDARIKYIRLLKNKGVGHARNKGIDVATGDWVSFLDSDDEYLSEGFEYLLETIERTIVDIDVIGFSTIRENERGGFDRGGFAPNGIWEEHKPTYEEVVLKKFISGDIHYCIRRNILTKNMCFNEQVNGFELAFFSRLAKYGHVFQYLNLIVTRCYRHDNSQLSKDPLRRWPEQFGDAYRKFVSEHNRVLKQEPRILNHYYKRITLCYVLAWNPKALFWLTRSLLYDGYVKFKLRPDVFVKKLLSKLILYYKLKQFYRPRLVKIKYKDAQFSIVVDPSNGFVDKTIYVAGCWDSNISKALSDLLKPESVFVDVGANIGFFSLLGSELLRGKGKVISFEPLLRCRKQFQKSIELNANAKKLITVLPYACGESKGEAHVHIAAGNIGGSSIIRRAQISRQQEKVEIEVVEVVTLDSILESEKRIDVIKIDVEGYEPSALFGARRVLEKFQPAIILEYTPHLYEQMKSNLTADFIKFMQELNYCFYDLNKKPIDIDRLTTDLLRESGQIDVLCVPVEDMS